MHRRSAEIQSQDLARLRTRLFTNSSQRLDQVVRSAALADSKGKSDVSRLERRFIWASGRGRAKEVMQTLGGGMHPDVKNWVRFDCVTYLANFMLKRVHCSGEALLCI